MFTAKYTYNEHVSIGTGPWKKGSDLINHIFFYIKLMVGCVRATYLGKRWRQEAVWEEGRPAVMLLGCYLSRTTYLNIVAEQVYSFMKMILPDGGGLLQQDNALCHTTKIV